MTSSASSGANNVKTSAESPINALVTDLENIWHTIVTDAQNAWNSLVTIVNGILATIAKVPGVSLVQSGINLITTGHQAQGGIVKASQGFVTHGPQLVLAGDNPGGAEAFVPLQGGNIPVTLSSSTQQAGSSPMAFNIRIDNATLTSTKDAQKLGLQIAYSAQRELSRSGYSRGS